MTINVSLGRVNDLTNTNTAQQTINSNSDTITEGFVDALNNTGDQMKGTLDMNSNRIINLPKPVSGSEPARLQDITSTSIPIVLPSISGVVTGTSTTTTINTVFSGSGNLPVSQLNAGSGANNATFWRGDGVWASPGSASVTGGQNIVSSGANPTAVSIQTSANYTVISGVNTAAGNATSGAQLWVGNATDGQTYIMGTGVVFKDQTRISTAGTIAISTSTLAATYGRQGAVAGSLSLASATGTGTPTIQAATASSNSYTLMLPTTLGATGAVYVSGGTGSPSTWSAVSTTSQQMLQSVSGGVPAWSTAVFPTDVSTNQILVSNANHTWSASQTVTNLTLTTPTLTTATMTGTSLLANATMSGNLTFSTGTIGVVGCTDTSSGSAGQIGEYISTSVISTGQNLFSNSASGLMSIVLTPGDWDVSGVTHVQASFTGTATTFSFTQALASINSTNGFNNVPGGYAGFSVPGSLSAGGPSVVGAFAVGPLRASIAATSTYWNVVLVNFSGTTGCSAFGTLRARRVR